MKNGPTAESKKLDFWEGMVMIDEFKKDVKQLTKDLELLRSHL